MISAKTHLTIRRRPAIQLKRRCGTYIRMNKERIYVSQWDPKKCVYTLPVEYFNNLLDEYIPQNELLRRPWRNISPK